MIAAWLSLSLAFAAEVEGSGSLDDASEAALAKDGGPKGGGGQGGGGKGGGQGGGKGGGKGGGEGKGDGKGKGGKGKKDKDPTVGPFKKDKYPTQEIYRPLTAPKGMVEATVAVDLTHVDFGGASSDAIGAGLGARYGISDEITVRASSGFALSPNAAWSEAISIGGSYLAHDSSELDVAAGLDLDLSLADGGVHVLRMHADTRYLVADKVYVFGGHNLLNVGLTDPVSLSTSVAGGVGYQFSDTVAGTLSTTLLTVGWTPSVTALWWADFIPVDVGVVAAVSRDIDILASVGLGDLLHPDTIITAIVGGNFRF